jgi:hypothetical protein
MSQVRARSLLFAALLAAACQKGGSSPAGIQRRVVLESVSSCGELNTEVQDAAVRLMRAQLDGSKTTVGYAAAVPRPWPLRRATRRRIRTSPESTRPTS